MDRRRHPALKKPAYLPELGELEKASQH